MKPWFWHALFWFVLLTVIHRIACWGACRSTIEGYVPALRQWAYTLGTLAVLAGSSAGVWWLIHITLGDSSAISVATVFVLVAYLGVQLAGAVWLLGLERGRYLKFLLISFLIHFGLWFIYGAIFDNIVVSTLFIP